MATDDSTGIGGARRILVLVAVTVAMTTVPTAARAYGWPVKPFFAQHPVRGFFGDPRIGNGGQRQFHFGVDVSAPNGTPVYATITGRVWLINAEAVGVSAGGGRSFEYWHLRPAVRAGQYVTAYRTIVGHIEKPSAHVHFSETRSGRYVNPLRPSAMRPFLDRTRPTIERVRAERDGEVVADVRDATPVAVAPPWANLPVMPALVRWRLLGRTAGRWTTAADFRWTIPSAGAFFSVYELATTQNHVRRPGLYRVRLARGVRLRRGLRIQILVADISGNCTLATFPLDRPGPVRRSRPDGSACTRPTRVP
jgi:hypothetical protein